MKEAMLYQKLEDGRVRCALCAHRCVIRPGKKGICAVRENRDGTLVTLTYGRAVSAAVDPIEKKPLYHFYPSSTAFSVATAGCNFRCTFCQNADISQIPHEQPDWERWARDLPPEQVVAMARREGCRSIAYTYTEPTIFFEYVYDCARLATPVGLKNVLVTNGYMTTEMLDTIGSDLHAANVDLKGGDAMYRDLCGARQQPVLDAIAYMHHMGVWVEVTTLVIPGQNDDQAVLREIATFLAGLDPNIPWHLSRFSPRYKLLDAPSTPAQTLQRAAQIGYEAGLRYVYVGNVPGNQHEHTRCPQCGAICIYRLGYNVQNLLADGKHCPTCGYELAMVI